MKVLLLNLFIPDYRLHIFNLLGGYVELTVGHSGSLREEKNLTFKQIHLPLRKIGPFWFYSANLNRILNNYDVIVSDYNIRYFDRNFLIHLQNRRYRWVIWGIGVSASRDNKYDDNKRLDWIRNLVFKKADAMIFYTNYPVAKHIKAGFDPRSLFVAHNTTYVSFNENLKFKKKHIMFIGTLYRQKKLSLLLSSYLSYSKLVKNPVKLIIVGDGAEAIRVKAWIETNNQNGNVELIGSVYNPPMLEQLFRESYACVSPAQAGLSVLNSMGHGTAFVTKADAITGGERFNIINGENGIIYNDDSELKDVLMDIHKHPQKFIDMGFKAREYYLQNRTPEEMVKSIAKACDYVVRKY